MSLFIKDIKLLKNGSKSKYFGFSKFESLDSLLFFHLSLIFHLPSNPFYFCSSFLFKIYLFNHKFQCPSPSRYLFPSP